MVPQCSTVNLQPIKTYSKRSSVASHKWQNRIDDAMMHDHAELRFWRLITGWLALVIWWIWGRWWVMGANMSFRKSSLKVCRLKARWTSSTCKFMKSQHELFQFPQWQSPRAYSADSQLEMRVLSTFLCHKVSVALTGSACVSTIQSKLLETKASHSQATVADILFK